MWTAIAAVSYLVLGSGAIEAVIPRPFAMPIMITLGDETPDLPVGTVATVSLTCEGHPHTLEWEAIAPGAGLPAGPGFRCWDPAGNFAIPCEGEVVLDQCGEWQIRGGCFYSHIVDGQPFSNYAETSVFVFGCDVFADGFESGDTINWTSTVP